MRLESELYQERISVLCYKSTHYFLYVFFSMFKEDQEGKNSSREKLYTCMKIREFCHLRDDNTY